MCVYNKLFLTRGFFTVKLLNFLKRSLIIAGLSLSALVIAAPSINKFTSAQTAQIKQIIHQYLIQNPHVLVEASQALQKKEMKTAQAKAIKAAKANAAALFRAPNSAVGGNPKGSVTLVEFFDYQCMHCRQMTPILQKLMKDNKNLRVVFKDFAIFGKASVMAAQATLAANIQGKYYPFHEAIMTSQTQITPKLLQSIAKKLNLNLAKFKKDMKSKTVQNQIANSYKLAQAMNLMGTPEFLIAKTNFTAQSKSPILSIPGAADQKTIQKMIDKLSK